MCRRVNAAVMYPWETPCIEDAKHKKNLRRNGEMSKIRENSAILAQKNARGCVRKRPKKKRKDTQQKTVKEYKEKSPNLTENLN